MVTLDFKIDEDLIAEEKVEKRALLVEQDSTTLRQTCLMMPVRFQIDDIHIFDWINLPLLYLVDWPLKRLRSLRDLHVAECVLPENSHLFFKLSGDYVEVSYRDKKVLVDYQVLLEAFEAFAERVRKLFNEEFPEMQEHPYFGKWLKGQPYP